VAEPVLKGDRAAVLANDPLGNSQAQTGAAQLTAAGLVSAVEAQLNQPIYYLADPDYQGTQYPQYVGDILDYIENGVNAKLYGVEFAYIQHLGFLPGGLNGFGIMANFSKTWSAAGTLPLRTDNPALHRQTPTMWNLGPSYDKGRFSARLGATYNSASIYQYQWQYCTRPSKIRAVRAANTLLLVIDSSLDEVSGPQGQWLTDRLDHVPADVDFVFVMDHHRPYTSSSDMKLFGGGHAARSKEQALAKMLEERQAHARYRIVVFSGHVHNYERHEHGGVTYFVTGGGAAHAYPIERAPDDPYQSKEINYHYLMVEVDNQQLKITMNRLQLTKGKALWTQPDSVKIAVPAAAAAQTAGH
jgi:hypothetical protein